MKLKALVAIAMFAALVAQGQKLPGDNVTLPSAKGGKWGPVKFTHQHHLAFSDCVYCHHTNPGLTDKNLSSAKVPLCVECHTRTEGDAKNPKSKDGTEVWAKEAYHINCIECHKGEITKIPKDIGMSAIKKQSVVPGK